ncbi:MAG: SPASM domain-containing protein [Tannerellaceae bacterium]|nr:SPASM domain-containing protein [Tannerellaceae bacterium]
MGTCSIDPLGNIYPCHNLNYKEFQFGNLLDENIEFIFEKKLLKNSELLIILKIFQFVKNVSLNISVEGGV